MLWLTAVWRTAAIRCNEALCFWVSRSRSLRRTSSGILYSAIPVSMVRASMARMRHSMTSETMSLRY